MWSHDWNYHDQNDRKGNENQNQRSHNLTPGREEENNESDPLKEAAGTSQMSVSKESRFGAEKKERNSKETKNSQTREIKSRNQKEESTGKEKEAEERDGGDGGGTWNHPLKQRAPMLTGVVFGTQNRNAAEVEEAFRIGYREFDTAESYDNITEVAVGLKRAARHDFKIIYKFTLRKEHDELAAHLAEASKLFDGFLDVAMIHNLPESTELLSETVKQMSKLKEAGLIRRVGLSGLEQTQAIPEILQHVDIVENDATKAHADVAVRTICGDRGIEYLGYGISHLIDDSVHGIAKKYGITATALMLAWTRSQGIRPLMSSGRTEQRIENAAAWHHEVPQLAIKELAAHLSASPVSQPAASLAALPEVPAECQAPLQTLTRIAFLDNHAWNVEIDKYSDEKTVAKFIRLLRQYACQLVPSVVEVSKDYHGKTVEQLVRRLPKTNHCDRQKLLVAFIAGLRNTAANFLEAT